MITFSKKIPIPLYLTWNSSISFFFLGGGYWPTSQVQMRQPGWRPSPLQACNGHRAIQLHAGTSPSSRQRGEPNNFNLIEISPHEVEVTRLGFDDAQGAFTKAEAQQFSRASGEFVV